MPKIQQHRITIVIALLLICVLHSNAQTLSELIKVNQIGYLSNEAKVAYVSDESSISVGAWRLKKVSDNSVVYQGSGVSSGIDDEASGEIVYTLDFGDFNENGNYYIEVDGIGKSYDFEISNTVYNEVFDIVMKGFYFQRSGIELVLRFTNF